MKRFAQLSLLFGLLAGCQRESTEVALVVIDGCPITTGDVREAVLLHAKINELSERKPKEENFNKWANETAVRLFGSLINARLIEKEIAEKGVRPTDLDLAKVLADYNKATQQNAANIDELAKAFGESGKAFRKVADQAAGLAAYERAYWKVDLPAIAVSQYCVRMTNDMERAKEIDAEAAAKAQKAYERLQKGEKWDAVAAACSEDKLMSKNFERYAREWFSVGDDAMGMQELAAQLPKMKAGDYTKPFEARDGMLIVRLNGKTGKLYNLSRMLFRMAPPIVLPKDFETAKQQLAAEVERSRKRETMKRLRDAAKFEYPMGTNFVYRIWPE